MDLFLPICNDEKIDQWFWKELNWKIINSADFVSHDIIIYYCTTNYHTLRLTKYSFTSSHICICRPEVLHCMIMLSAQGLTRLTSRCFQNSVPCSCRTVILHIFTGYQLSSFQLIIPCILYHKAHSIFKPAIALTLSHASNL